MQGSQAVQRRTDLCCFLMQKLCYLLSVQSCQARSLAPFIVL